MKNGLEKISLRTARVHAGLKQESAAAQLGISGVSLGKYEKGERYPRIDVAYKMSKLYGVPIDMIDFCCGD